jgi:acyl carrier protein
MEMSSGDSEDIIRSISEILSGILGLDPGTPLDTKKPMEDMGLDSILAMDLLSALEAKFSITLEETAHVDHPTIGDLANHVYKRSQKLRAKRERGPG